MNKYYYYYSGPVMLFDKCIDQCWSGKTMASSERQARSYLSYQFKKEHGLEARSSIKLPEKIKGEL